MLYDGRTFLSGRIVRMDPVGQASIALKVDIRSSCERQGLLLTEWMPSPGKKMNGTMEQREFRGDQPALIAYSIEHYSSMMRQSIGLCIFLLNDV